MAVTGVPVGTLLTGASSARCKIPAHETAFGGMLEKRMQRNYNDYKTGDLIAIPYKEPRTSMRWRTDKLIPAVVVKVEWDAVMLGRKWYHVLGGKHGNVVKFNSDSVVYDKSKLLARGE